MPIYRVRINAENLVSVIDGKDVRCGFFKNEYVWASSPAEAANKAKAGVTELVQKSAGLFIEDGKELILTVESVDPGQSPLVLLKSEGLVLYESS